MNLTLKEMMRQWSAKACPVLFAVTLGSSIGVELFSLFLLNLFIYFFLRLGFCVAQAGLELSAS